MFETHRIRWGLAIVLPALMAASGLWTLGQLPEGATVPIHFDIEGKADGWAQAHWGLFMLPLLAFGSLGLVWLLPRIDPRADKLKQSLKAQLNMVLATQLLMATVQAQIIALGLGHAFDFGRSLLFMVGLLLMVVGNMAGKLRWNYTVGIRTPWTLANERVWDKTHRFGGVVFFIAGVALILAAALGVPGSWGVTLIVSASLLSTALCIFKSWWLWRQENQRP